MFQWKNRLKDNDDEFLPDNELQKLYQKKAALDPAYNKIVCISVGYVKGDTLFYKSFTGDQKDIITQFYDIINTGKYTPAGYNIIAFDMPVVRIKSREVGYDGGLLKKFEDSFAKPWNLEDTFVDLMPAMKGTYYYSMSFDEACYIEGVKSPKCDINGSQVTETFYKEGVDRVATYCNRDVVACAELFFSMIGKKDFLKNFVDKSDATTDSTELTDKIPFLERLRDMDSLTDDVVEEISSTLSKSKVLKKDRENLKAILTAHYLTKGDKKAVKEKKTKEINDFIDNYGK